MGLIGVAITCRPARKKTAFVFVVALLATLVSLATGSVEITTVCNMVFYAACWLVPYYLVVGVLRPMILNLEKPEAREAIANPDSSFWLRPSNEIREAAPLAPGIANSEESSALAGG